MLKTQESLINDDNDDDKIMMLSNDKQQQQQRKFFQHHQRSSTFHQFDNNNVSTNINYNNSNDDDDDDDDDEDSIETLLFDEEDDIHVQELSTIPRTTSTSTTTTYQFNEQQIQMSLEQIICDDLHAFENRLMEIIHNYEPQTKRWRWILAISIIITLITAIQWLLDIETLESSFWQSLYNHRLFTINCLILIILFLCFGIHQRVIQQNIIAQRIRDVIGQFNMDCTDQGRLILMPKPFTFYNDNFRQYFNHNNNNNNFYNHNYSPQQQQQQQSSSLLSNSPVTQVSPPSSSSSYPNGF
ncbi:Nuclear envelope phosphatase-regulatory subunit 1 [Dermatophagoides pteronyssinus]|uniref:Transmembrane protein 188 n=2 Tax=Dermatophagoides pteronyssinus TaxID=6956 RepID=A0ABQ8J876_DERPT|nr:Nuclear envelope phosphatase-regulatory subunit 1 [Dermatophagoides pteronyssinus]